MSDEEWFEVVRYPSAVTMIREPHHSEDVKAYLIEGERDVAVLDTGMGVGDFRGIVEELTDREPLVVQSHAHWDHIGSSAQFERVLVHPAEADSMGYDLPNEFLRPWFEPELMRGIPLPEDFDVETATMRGAAVTGHLNDGGQIDLGGRVIEVFHTPGHSPGGITVYDSHSRLLFPADAVNLGPLYLFSEQADLPAYQLTLDVLAGLAGRSEAVYPSHYDVPMTPADVVATRDALKEIVAGREPDEVQERREVYQFERFVFWIRPGAVEELG